MSSQSALPAAALPASARSSDLLAALAHWPQERLFVRDMISHLGERAYALLVLLLGLPNCFPMPPPIPMLCGLMLAGVAVQLLIARPQPWLPAALMNRSLETRRVAAAARRILPWLARVERVCKPRMVVLQQNFALRVIGFVLLALAAGLLVAAPVIGQIPLGLGVCLIGLALVERDGLVLIAGCLIGAIGLALTAGFAWALIVGAKLALLALFG